MIMVFPTRLIEGRGAVADISLRERNKAKRRDAIVRAAFQLFADMGYPNNQYCTVNELQDGVWEFKLGRVRVSFYDTDGRGSYNAKRRVISIVDSEFPDEEFWWLPLFDEDLRLGHCFGKTTQRTEDEDISETLRVREEDLAHDRI